MSLSALQFLVVVQFEVLRLAWWQCANTNRETGIYIRAIARRSRGIAADIRATGIYSRANAADSGETGIYWSEIATYRQEIAADIEELAANIGEIGVYSRRTQPRMAANKAVPLISA